MATIQDIFKWVETFNQTTPANEKEVVEDYINRLLQFYQKQLHLLSVCPVQSQADWERVLTEIESLCQIISECLAYYSQARIADSINLLHDCLAGNPNLLVLTISPDNDIDRVWYRMRLQEKGKRVFPAKEMFHIPFNLRHKVSLARYSVSGYPCLYISRSIWANWEEMHEPRLSDFSVSRLELQKSIQVLDLRVPLWNDEIDEVSILRQLYTIPLVLACSVRTRYPDDNFKPEYIIPQLVMLAITYPDINVMGCAYTSTMRNPVFIWPDVKLLDNISLPVMSVNNATPLCPHLTSLFKISNSTNYDFELIKEPFATMFWNTIDEGLIISGAKQYEASIFGQMQERLARFEVVQL